MSQPAVSANRRGVNSARVAAEREFWDAHAPPLERLMRRWRRGPEPNTMLALDSLEPLAGRRVLDFACGAGVTSAWLAARGAEVIGVDVAPKPLELARSLFERLGLEGTFVCGDLVEIGDELPVFDAVFGQYALHHVDVGVYAPLLAARLAPGGVGAFVETMDSNRVLLFARRNLAGRFGVRRLGSPGERPIGPADLDHVREAFGGLELGLRQLKFARILDRQVPRFRHPMIREATRAIDEWLVRRPRLHGLSYHRVIIVCRR